MSETKTNGISLVVNDSHITINADISFKVENKEDSPSAHISDVIYQLVLGAIKEQKQALLGPGNYKMMFTSCTAAVAPAEEETPDLSGLSEDELEGLKQLLASRRAAIAEAEAAAEEVAETEEATEEAEEADEVPDSDD